MKLMWRKRLILYQNVIFVGTQSTFFSKFASQGRIYIFIRGLTASSGSSRFPQKTESEREDDELVGRNRSLRSRRRNRDTNSGSVSSTGVFEPGSTSTSTRFRFQDRLDRAVDERVELRASPIRRDSRGSCSSAGDESQAEEHKFPDDRRKR